MQSQHHTNNAVVSEWHACHSADLVGDWIEWRLNAQKSYGFLEAYKREPHREFIGLRGDKALIAFVKKWGPLTRRSGETAGRDPAEAYRREHALLHAWASLLSASVKSVPDLVSPMLGLLRLDSGAWIAYIRPRLGLDGTRLVFDEEVEQALVVAPSKAIEHIADFMIGSFPVPWPGIRVARTKRTATLQPFLGTHSLRDALYWMLWQDLFQGRALTFCQECGSLIRQQNRHARKFCSPECAKRKTNRESARRVRAKFRTLRLPLPETPNSQDGDL